jgi:hypothetical protein
MEELTEEGQGMQSSLKKMIFSSRFSLFLSLLFLSFFLFSLSLAPVSFPTYGMEIKPTYRLLLPPPAPSLLKSDLFITIILTK